MAVSFKRICSDVNISGPDYKKKELVFKLTDNNTSSKVSSNASSSSSKNGSADVGLQNYKNFIKQYSCSDQNTTSMDSDENLGVFTKSSSNYRYNTDSNDFNDTNTITNTNNNDNNNDNSIKDETIRRSSINSRSGSFSVSQRKHSQLFRDDLVARERCFDYITQCIDEVWGRYCNTTANAEALVYGDSSNKNNYPISPASLSSNSPVSYNTTTIGTNSDRTTSNDDFLSMKPKVTNKQIKSFNSNTCKPLVLTDNELEEGSDYSCESDYEDYKSEVTNITEYETDSGSDVRTVSNLPDSVKLQSLKCRLARAKEDLEDIYDSNEYQDCVDFWRRWDMLKYNAVEMMEDDDDDDVIESAIEELEMGRFYREV
ncbi:hypothetical protein TPHA_0E03950 [Tetrapisispora phaffii CBS 4417]|uniref:Uncharacterized protein n=1 Tax=Tetrapisispora phaffii (strain ATCC 24235 / CBS 4417 / NBRC 1672 / NRRL Y-8282 / UCD 70-5) TaxID=1071381 RepID=G8BUA6_TETPH|nr:hypothetical protein TPHA_0E03950 [Tetrapisispora phaffii CBS 4417]CCE63484.1 hypothetical protein TPHA_0E03950 [Tetrapisispora phaffii CBS 4417]